MKKRGFTLIELLAVIVILTLIALIAVPTIIDIITKARKSAFKDSAYGIIKAGELYYAENLLSNEITGEKIFEFPNDIGSLPVQGKLPSSGQMKISIDGDIAIAISDGRYCAKKEYIDTDIIVDEDLDNCILSEPVVSSNFIFNYGKEVETNEGVITVKQNDIVVIEKNISGSNGKSETALNLENGEYDVTVVIDNYIYVGKQVITGNDTITYNLYATGSVEFVVKDDSGALVRDAEVRLYIGSNLLTTKNTDSNGKVVFEKLKYGSYNFYIQYDSITLNKFVDLSQKYYQETVTLNSGSGGIILTN